MAKKNIFERAAAVQHTVTPFFFQQEIKKQKPKIPGLTSPIVSFDELRLLSIAKKLKTANELAVLKDKKISILRDQISALKKVRLRAQKTMTPVTEIYRAAAKSGRPITYYAAESVSLCSDLEYVLAVHNIELFSNEIEKVKKEIISGILKRSKAFADLSPREKKRVLEVLGTKNVFPDYETKQVSLPTTAARKYSIHIRLRAPEEEYFDPEVLEHFEEEQARWEANGDGKRGNCGGLGARLATAGMAQAGIKTVKMYTSNGKKKPEDEEVEP